MHVRCLTLIGLVGLGSLGLGLIMGVELLEVQVHGHPRLDGLPLLYLSSLLWLGSLNHDRLIAVGTTYMKIAMGYPAWRGTYQG